MHADTGARRTPISPDLLAELRPHLVDLTRGRLSTGGLATTTAQDVELIFRQHLPEFVARARGDPCGQAAAGPGAVAVPRRYRAAGRDRSPHR